MIIVSCPAKAPLPSSVLRYLSANENGELPFATHESLYINKNIDFDPGRRVRNASVRYFRRTSDVILPVVSGGGGRGQSRRDRQQAPADRSSNLPRVPDPGPGQQ